MLDINQLLFSRNISDPFLADHWISRAMAARHLSDEAARNQPFPLKGGYTNHQIHQSGQIPMKKTSVLQRKMNHKLVGGFNLPL